MPPFSISLLLWEPAYLRFIDLIPHNTSRLRPRLKQINDLSEKSDACDEASVSAPTTSRGWLLELDITKSEKRNSYYNVLPFFGTL